MDEAQEEESTSEHKNRTPHPPQFTEPLIPTTLLDSPVIRTEELDLFPNYFVRTITR